MERFAQQVTNRIAAIETPDVSPLAIRLSAMERKVEDLASTLNVIADRMPIVLE
jgi:hypothetical protein